MRITLVYCLDGSNLANKVASHLSKLSEDYNVERWPCTEGIRNKTFWLSLRNGIIDTEVILFILTKQYVEINEKYLFRLNQKTASGKYRFGWIIAEEDITINAPYIPRDIELKLTNYNSDKDQSSKAFDQLANYLSIVKLIVIKDREISEERKKRMQKSLLVMLAVLMGYSVVIVLTIYSHQHETAFNSKSNAEFIMIVMALMSLLVAFTSFYYWISKHKKAESFRERMEFSKELDSSLSKSASHKKFYDDVMEYFSSSAYSTTSLASQLFDFMFPAFHLNLTSKRNDVNKTDEFIPKSDYYEVTHAMGETDYQPLGHLKFNWQQMKGYYDISKKQATTSFRLAIFISIIGILIIAFAIISPLFPPFASTNSLIPVIGTIGGAVVELFAGTILVVYTKSLSQMNHYHQALSEYQHYLSCVNLVGKINDPGMQNEMYVEIIQKELDHVQQRVQNKNGVKKQPV